MRYLHSLMAFAFAAIAGSALVNTASGQLWTGAAVGLNDWSAPANWSPATEPGIGSIASFGTSSKTTVTMFAGDESATGVLFLGGANPASSYTFSSFSEGLTMGGSAPFIRNEGAALQTFGNPITFAATATGTRTIQQASTGSGELRFNGNVTNASGVLTVDKIGTGVITFNGTVTSNGGLSVSNSNSTGAIVFGAIGSGISSISVTGNGTVQFGSPVSATTINVTNANASFTGAASATSSISGVGTYNGLVTISTGATLSPGVGDPTSISPQQTFNNGLAFQSGSKFAWDLNGVNYDTIAVNGAATTIASNVESVLNLKDLNPLVSWTRNIIVGAVAPTGLFGSITLTGTVPTGVTASNFAWGTSGNNITLSFTAVPEPSSMALLGVAGLVGGVYARRRQKLAKKPAVAC